MQVESVQDHVNFMVRFSSLSDAVVRKVEFLYLPGRNEVSILIESPDNHSESGWCNLTLSLSGVTDFSLREGRTTCVVVSPLGLQFLLTENEVCLAFDASSELSVKDEFKNCDFFVIAKSFMFFTAPTGIEENLVNVDL